MLGHGAKFDQKMEQAIAALLSHRSIEEAAREVGISAEHAGAMDEGAGVRGRKSERRVARYFPRPSGDCKMRQVPLRRQF